MVIDEEGKSLGAMKKDEALALAKEKGLDLIEIAPMAKPPVARIMSFDKFRYQQEKKLKKQRAQQRGQEMKQVQISIKEASHDLEIKSERVNKFLSEGNQVEIVMVLRGREKANKDFAREKLANFIKMIDPEHRVIMEPKVGGRGINMQIVKK
jgi:translation initiation factor IF-3